MTNTDATRKSREVRLGLVMYGGVSLAIYINGIAQELFRAVRGRGTYRLLKALTDSDVVVDVLSGSSAGGINGILLGYALCNECEFEPSAKLWREHGDIGELMRGIDEPLETYKSLLDSEKKYEPWLLEAFEELAKNKIDVERAREDESPFEELDLFVTGTDFYGRKCATVDDRGASIEVKDHRAVFWLKHRAGRKEPFSPGASLEDQPSGGRRTREDRTTHAALARLARITSCFPGAFAPVTVDASAPVSQRLRRWAAIRGPGERVYIDGGVLDNKPFSSTLEAIYSRLADRPVSRWLLYVEPDPERFGGDPAELESPAAVEAALASLTALPAYESIADDLRSLRRHNEQAARIGSLRDALVSLADDLEKPSDAGRTLDHGASSAAEVAKSHRDEAESKAYARFRLIGLGDQVFRALFTREVDGARANRADPERDVAEAQRKLREWFHEKLVRNHQTNPKAFFDLDVGFRLRRLLHLTYRYQDALMVSGLAASVNRQIETLEIMRAAMERTVEERAAREFGQDGEALPSPVDDAWARAVWERVFEALRTIAAVAGPEHHARRSQAGLAHDERRELKEFASRITILRAALSSGSGGTAQPVAALEQSSFFTQSDEYERRLFEGTPLEHAYANYERVDGLLYPIEIVAGLKSYDVVKLARVSPRDARFGLASIEPDEKVTGARVGHFAAFFKRSWRSNDILWGRLDGSCELVDVLADAARIRELFCPVIRDRDSCGALETPEELGAGAGPETVAAAEAHAGAEARAQLEARLAAFRRTVAEVERDASTLPLPEHERAQLFAWLRRLSSDVESERRSAVVELEVSKRQSEVKGPMHWLVLGAQLEVLGPGLNDVISDDHEEQLTYLEPNAGVRNTVKALRLTRKVLGQIGKTPEQLIRFFRDEYRVGREDLSNIPAFVVADWVTRALILVRNALLVSSGRHAVRIRAQPLYQMFFGWPLRALAALSTLLRRAPHWLAAFTLSAFAYVLLSAVVLLVFFDALFAANKAVASALFVGLPLLLLGFLWLVARLRGRGGWASKSVRLLGGVVGIAFAFALAPALASVMHTRPDLACYGVFGAHLGRLCEGAWTSQSIRLSRWLVLGSSVLGLLWVFGVFGWIGRKLAVLEERRRRRAKNSG